MPQILVKLAPKSSYLLSCPLVAREGDKKSKHTVNIINRFLPESSYCPKELLASLLGQDVCGVYQHQSRLSVGENSIIVLVKHLEGGQLEVGGSTAT